MITVAFTVSCLRQRNLREAIDSWAAARGSHKARFVFCLEPPGTFPVWEFTAYLDRVFPDRAIVFQNASVLGCLRNTRQAIGMAMVLSEEDFGVVAEEDVEVADDVIEYLEWARDAYREDGSVATVCAHARASDVPDPAAVVRAPWFCPLVWGTWKREWDEVIAPVWGAWEDTGNPESWDVNLQQRWAHGAGRSVFPARSRSVHRGEHSVLMGPQLGEYVYKASVSTCYQPHYEPQQFREIAYPGGRLVV